MVTIEELKQRTSVLDIKCNCGNPTFLLYRTYTYGLVSECTKCHKIELLEC